MKEYLKGPDLPAEQQFESLLGALIDEQGDIFPELSTLAYLHKESRAEIIQEGIGRGSTHTRRGVLKLFGAGILTLGVGTVGVIKAKNAGEKSATEAAEKRLTAIETKFRNWEKLFTGKAFALMEEFLHFFVLFKKLKRVANAAKAGISGVWDDITDFIKSGDTNPNKMEESFESMIEKDPELSQSYNKIKQLMKDLKNLSSSFKTMVSDTLDMDQQKDKFMDEFFEGFKKHMQTWDLEGNLPEEEK